MIGEGKARRRTEEIKSSKARLGLRFALGGQHRIVLSYLSYFVLFHCIALYCDVL